MGIIFDLDQTLIDSNIAKPYRGKDWKTTYSLIPKFKEYEGLKEVTSLLVEYNFNVAIVTTSPSSYCKKVVDFWQLPCHHIVGYHDARIKPAPDQMILALDKLGCKPNEVLSIGDRIIDIHASHAAQIASVGCLWGSSEDLATAKPNHLISTPSELVRIIRDFYSL